MTPALSVRDLSVTYETQIALDALTADFHKGEITGLIGPNGAGKTSFIKALCGRVVPSAGDIRINGTPLPPGKARQKLIGLVPQDIGLYGHMTARENLTAFARIMGLPKPAAPPRVDAALKAVDMDHKSSVRVDALSGGMKRRINVAAAIMHGPQVLILDEPTAGVDVPARDTIHRLARRLANTGMAVLLITHELEQAEALCDKILILAGGNPLAFDKPAKILSGCYHGGREIMLRFEQPPNSDIMDKLAPFHFAEGELPTLWTAMTELDEVNFVGALTTALGENRDTIREISLRRPGLSSLMRYIEKTGALPC